MKRKMVTLLITEEQEQAILPHIIGAVAIAFDTDISTINEHMVRARSEMMAHAIGKWIEGNRCAAPLKNPAT